MKCRVCGVTLQDSEQVCHACGMPVSLAVDAELEPVDTSSEPKPRVPKFLPKYDFTPPPEIGELVDAVADVVDVDNEIVDVAEKSENVSDKAQNLHDDFVVEELEQDEEVSLEDAYSQVAGSYAEELEQSMADVFGQDDELIDTDSIYAKYLETDEGTNGSKSYTTQVTEDSYQSINDTTYYEQEPVDTYTGDSGGYDSYNQNTSFYAADTNYYPVDAVPYSQPEMPYYQPEHQQIPSAEPNGYTPQTGNSFNATPYAPANPTHYPKETDYVAPVSQQYTPIDTKEYGSPLLPPVAAPTTPKAPPIQTKSNKSEEPPQESAVHEVDTSHIFPAKKSNNTLIIGIIIGLVVIAAMLIIYFGTTWLGNRGGTPTPTTTPIPITQLSPSPTAQTSMAPTTPPPSSPSQMEFEGEKIRVGKTGYGFISIPKTWKEYKNDAGDASLLQWSNGSGYIVSLYVYPETVKNSSALVDPFVNNLKEVKEANRVETSKTFLNGLETDVIQSWYLDGKALNIWIFKALDGRVHYISVEGVAANIQTMSSLVINGFSLED